MSNGLMTINGANPMALFAPGATLSQRALAAMQSRQGQPDELGSGITGGFGVIGYKGKAWHIKYGGEDTIVKQRDERTGMEVVVPHLMVVLINAAPHLTKTFYEQQYVEGSNAPPDCSSSDGVKPDVASPKKQADLCATCRHNQYGSRVSADGQGRGKACQDTKRLAVVPAEDIDNEANGGPMLLRIPPASLKNVQAFAGLMQRSGYPYYGVAVWLYFEGDEAYPLINFKPARPLTDDEFAKIEAYRTDDRVARILNATETQLQIAAPAQPDPLFSAAPPVAAPSPAPVQQPVQSAAPAPVQQPTQSATQASVQQTPPQAAPAPVQAAPPVQVAPAPVHAAPPVSAAPAPVAAAAPQAAATSGDGGDIDSFLDSIAGM